MERRSAIASQGNLLGQFIMPDAMTTPTNIAGTYSVCQYYRGTPATIFPFVYVHTPSSHLLWGDQLLVVCVKVMLK
jgi:hypothetical protein